MTYAKQSDFMKPYINFNNEKRIECSKYKDKFGVDQSKLSNNSLFGKQIEDNGKYKDTRIANNKEKAKKIASQVTLKNWHILSKCVTLYELRKSTILFDKPITTRLLTLEIAKLLMNNYYDQLRSIFSDNMELLYTDTDSFKLLIKNCNPYELKKHGLENLTDTSNFSIDTIFPLESGRYEKCFGYLKFENGECPCFEFNSKASKAYEKKRINQLRLVKAKGLKKGFRNNILENDFKYAILYEKPLRLIQKHIKSKSFCVTMEDVEKDVIPVHSNKRESFLGLNISFPWGYRGNKHKLLLPIFRNNNTPSRKIINDLLKIYPASLFNLEYLEQYWVFEND